MAESTDVTPTARSPMLSCLIASTPRTGSALLCRGLAKTGLAGRPEEYFRTDGGAKLTEPLDLPKDWSACSRYVDAVVGRATGDNGVFSVKVHWHQFSWLIRTLRAEQSVGADEDAETVARFFPNPRFVHLRRIDTAAQALSYYRAVHSAVWSLPADGSLARRRNPAEADLRQVRWFQDLVETHERRWMEWFERHDVQPLEITYEELARDYRPTIARVLDFLEVGRPPLGISPVRDFLRQAGPWSAYWAARYAEQRSTLAPQPEGEAWAEMDRLDLPVRAARTSPRHPSDGPNPAPTPRIMYSCVTDRPPLFNYQSLVWALTLLRLAGRSPADLVVHAIAGTSPGHLSRLRSLDVGVEIVEPFDERNAFANKLRQLTSPALADADWVVLCDCDLAFRAEVSAYVARSAIGGKVVDAGFPPYAAWVRLARQAGIEGDLIAARATDTLRWTCANNLNGGFLIVPKAFLAPLAEAWPRWLYWILEHHATVPQHCGVVPHAFQVSFGLAALELRLPVTPLPPSLNFSIQPPHRNEGVDPLVLHFHRRLTRKGLLMTTNVTLTNTAVESVNDLLRTPESQALLRKSLRQWQESL
jgi:LPS sulfotransferase NodH